MFLSMVYCAMSRATIDENILYREVVTMRTTKNFTEEIRQKIITECREGDSYDGDYFELLVRAFFGLEIKRQPQGKTDLIITINGKKYCCDTKQGGGQLSSSDRKILKGSKTIIYCPQAQNVKTFDDLLKTEIFVTDRIVFCEMLKSVGLYRSHKKDKGGNDIVAIQTFFNKKTGESHGRGLYKMLDGLYNLCDTEQAITFEEWIG